MHGRIGKRIIIYQTILVLETLHLSFVVCFAEAGKVASTYEFVFSYCPCTQVIFLLADFMRIIAMQNRIRPYLWAKITLLATVPQFESHESLSSHILCPEIQIVVWRHRFISFFSLIHVTCLGKCMPSTKFIQHPWCMYSLNNAHIFKYIANESYLGLAILQVFQPVNNSIPCKFCLSCRNGHGASRSKHTYAI